MRRIRQYCVISCILVASMVFTAYAQSEAGAELIALRSHLGLPSTSIIRLAPSSELEGYGSLNVYLAFGLDMGVRNNFRTWIEKWNKSHGKKRGMLRIVSELGQADVVLARYAELNKPTTESSGGFSGSTPGYVGGSSHSYPVVPVYAYVLVPRNGSSFDVIWRYTGTTSVGESRSSGLQLWEDLERILKARKKP